MILSELPAHLSLVVATAVLLVRPGVCSTCRWCLPLALALSLLCLYPSLYMLPMSGHWPLSHCKLGIEKMSRRWRYLRRGEIVVDLVVVLQLHGAAACCCATITSAELRL